MISSKNRITKRDFSRFFRGGRTFSGNLFILRVLCPSSGEGFLEKGEEGCAKVTFTTSKKVSKKAVVRNRLRRQGYAIINENKATLRKGCLYFFSFKKGVSESSFGEIRRDICSLLKEVGVRK